MKLICRECESELDFTDLHEDGTEILISLCKDCIENRRSDAYHDGYEAGLADSPCSEEDYKEGYSEAEAHYEEKLEVAYERIKELESEIEELSDASKN